MFNESRCPGVFINETFPSVNALLFADDIVLVNDTVGRLQAQLNVLHNFCEQFGMQINKEKTKVMVFRNGGTLRRNEKWYYGGTQLETISHYKYLGVEFSSRLVWTSALKRLCSQSLRGMMVIRTLFNQCGDMPVDIGLELFDKMVLPILEYGSEVWGYEPRDQIEAVQRKYCRILLGVSSRTQNEVVLAECGRLPLYTRYMTKCIKFWLKIVSSANRYTGACYEILKTLDEAGKVTWATKVKSLLLSYGFGHVWFQQGVGNIDLFLREFRQRLEDTARQTCLASIRESSLTMYASYKHTLDAELYLTIKIRKHRVHLARLRTGSNSLAVNRLRGRIARNERHCKYCLNLNIEQLEDEYHVVMVCPLYHDIRQRYLSDAVHNTCLYRYIELMSTTDTSLLARLSIFTYHCMKLHKGFMSY